MKNICIVAGARPNLIKVAPLIRAIDNAQGAACQLIYTGSEDDPSLEPSLFKDLQMPRPQAFFGVDSVSLNEITSRVMAHFDAYLNDHPVDVVIVVDDLASTMAAAIVTRIETAPGVTGKFAENQHCSLTIHNPQGLRDIDKYSVISDIRTPSKLNPKIPIENPYLLGLTNVYEANMKDNAFMGLFIFALTHSVFVVPVAVDDGSVHEDAQGHKSANIRLHFIANKDHPENKTLPIFTDLASLVLWKGVVDPKNPPKTMVLRFQDAADIATRDFNGLALNAFGPKPLFISNKFIDKIRSLDAYVREFGKQGHASIKPVEEPAGHDGKVDDSLLKH